MPSLLSFTIENFLSFSSSQTIRFGEDEMRPITAIFGANAGGKSNILKAMSAMKGCILHSAEANWSLPYNPFLLNEKGSGEPSRLHVTFRCPEGVFDYGFSFDGERVFEEALQERPEGSNKMKTIFRRGSDGDLSASSARQGFGKKLLKKTREGTLLITKAHEDNNPYANVVFDFFKKIRVDLDALLDNHGVFVSLLARDEGLRHKTLELLRQCDFSIRGLSVDEADIPEEVIAALPEEIREVFPLRKGLMFTTEHAIRNDEGEIVGMRTMDFWGDESLGTRQFLRVAVRILDAIDKGYILFIDEFATSVHQDLICALFDLVENQEGPIKGKLVLNTQNTAVMNAGLKRDAIILIEKGLSEQSVIVPLSSRHARESEAFEKRYREGLYGGVPFVGRG